MDTTTDTPTETPTETKPVLRYDPANRYRHDNNFWEAIWDHPRLTSEDKMEFANFLRLATGEAFSRGLNPDQPY